MNPQSGSEQRVGTVLRNFVRQDSSMAVYAKDKRDLGSFTRHWRNGTLSEYFREAAFTRPPLQYTHGALHKNVHPLIRHPWVARGRGVPAFYLSGMLLAFYLGPLMLFQAYSWRQGLLSAMSDDFVENRYTAEDLDKKYGTVTERKEAIRIALQERGLL